MNEQSLLDRICGELGIQPGRKKGVLLSPHLEVNVDNRMLGSYVTLGMDSLYKEWFEPHRPRDYKGLVEEFLDGARKRTRRGNAIDSFLGLGMKQAAALEDRDEAPKGGAACEGRRSSDCNRRCQYCRKSGVETQNK